MSLAKANFIINVLYASSGTIHKSSFPNSQCSCGYLYSISFIRDIVGERKTQKNAIGMECNS
jgi:hypothetical protein